MTRARRPHRRGPACGLSFQSVAIVMKPRSGSVAEARRCVIADPLHPDRRARSPGSCRAGGGCCPRPARLSGRWRGPAGWRAQRRAGGVHGPRRCALVPEHRGRFMVGITSGLAVLAAARSCRALVRAAAWRQASAGVVIEGVFLARFGRCLVTPAELRAASRLGGYAVAGLTSRIEQAHRAVAGRVFGQLPVAGAPVRLRARRRLGRL